MYQLILGHISILSALPLPPVLMAQAPDGPRRASWLAGRALLAHATTPLMDIQYGEQGKPAFPPGCERWFNLSHSGNHIALLLSDEGEVGCDIEVIRPRNGWQRLANALFSEGEHQELEREPPERQLAAFWRIWTRKEALVKQRGGSAWQMTSVDSAFHGALSLSQIQYEGLSIAVCTPTPFKLTAAHIQCFNGAA
ncbi:4'-phosphopantetheinyl transferase AcpT [Klebsiella aerogenes]|uniref:4'-phosphopantetheinyl transferase AcpT n=1 Tax=Klebsiella aerogenes TaxID=548 RepID=UPI000B40AC88|nr:4'-phosphopantetheinyl transferase AcpT [Klebsiella aerogenes]MEB7638093.1 4'-phosphopantetheinyl transferase AcpT [Klebsiella aerogenes]RNT27231.1 4'-phosphopantetheinyl transferase AcpT [Klebsiella aerogenes]HDS4946839.1 4'-phosphopantetheinyl transferase AcpT [Klebsiella aerogenes]